LGCGLHPSYRIPNENRGAFWRIFSSMKVRQPIARQDSLQTVIGTSRRLEAAQNFEIFSNIQDQK
jgi:hypothetical protein